MNRPYIQSELFRELVGMETLLKPEYYLKIIRYPKDIEVRLCRKKRNVLISLKMIDASTITTPAQMTAEITRIWQEITAECKRNDILK